MKHLVFLTIVLGSGPGHWKEDTGKVMPLSGESLKSLEVALAEMKRDDEQKKFWETSSSQRARTSADAGRRKPNPEKVD